MCPLSEHTRINVPRLLSHKSITQFTTAKHKSGAHHSQKMILFAVVFYSICVTKPSYHNASFLSSYFKKSSPLMRCVGDVAPHNDGVAAYTSGTPKNSASSFSVNPSTSSDRGSATRTIPLRGMLMKNLRRSGGFLCFCYYSP